MAKKLQEGSEGLLMDHPAFSRLLKEYNLKKLHGLAEYNPKNGLLVTQLSGGLNPKYRFWATLDPTPLQPSFYINRNVGSLLFLIVNRTPDLYSFLEFLLSSSDFALLIDELFYLYVARRLG